MADESYGFALPILNAGGSLSPVSAVVGLPGGTIYVLPSGQTTKTPPPDTQALPGPPPPGPSAPRVSAPPRPARVVLPRDPRLARIVLGPVRFAAASRATPLRELERLLERHVTATPTKAISAAQVARTMRRRQPEGPRRLASATKHSTQPAHRDSAARRLAERSPRQEAHRPPRHPTIIDQPLSFLVAEAKHLVAGVVAALQSRAEARKANKSLPPRQRRISSKGVGFVQSFEGWGARPYNDNPQHPSSGNATIGYGHFLHAGPPTEADMKKWGTITRAEGAKLLVADMSVAIGAVKRLVKIPLTQPQFDALCSFTFNVGAAGMASSTLLRDVNARRFGNVRSDLLLWTTDGHGHELPGLVARRTAEANMFVHGVYAHR